MKKLYLVFSAIIFFFIFSLKPCALVNNDNHVFINYLDPYVVENHNSAFFGQDGILNQVKQVMDDPEFNTSPYFIAFTKNNIYVSKIRDTYSFELDFKVNNDSLSLYYRFDDNDYGSNSFMTYSFNSNNFNLNDFKMCLQSGNYSRCGGNYRYTDSFTLFSSVLVDEDLRYIDINYFDYFDNYFIPYYSSIPFRTNDNYGQICNYQGDNYCLSFLVNGISDFVPYSSLYGYNEPSANPDIYYSSLYNVGILLDREHLDSTAGYFDFSYINDGLSIESVDFYGVEEVQTTGNSVNHYVLINSLISDFDYSIVNSNKHFRFTFSDNAFTYNDLSGYSQIYVKVNFTDTIKFVNGTWSYRFGSAYTLNIVLNDVCKDCLFVQLTSTFDNSLVFSKPSVSNSTILFYNDTSFLSSTYGQNLDFYIEPEFFDFSSSKSLSKISYSSAYYYYGYFNKVSFLDYQIGNNIGLSFNLKHDHVSLGFFGKIWNWFESIFHYNNIDREFSGDAQIIFFITSDLYWGNVIISEDNTNAFANYIDSSGNVQSTTIYGDFTVTGIPSSSTFSNMFKGFLNTSGSIIDAGSEILSLATSLFSSLSITIKAFVLLLFMLGAIGLFIKLIM